MPRCPFAVWDEITGGLGPYAAGPFKIVHHTTEGSSYAGARAAFAANRSDPHFTVDDTSIYQHIDTAKTARALRNDPGGSETNRSSAVQIEVVGFAGRPKKVATLQNVARICRWIETTHGVGQAWPNGFPRDSTNGGDPGGHNRNAGNWETRGGHYGHSQVPENVHWDPGYTPAEVLVVTPAAQFIAGPSFRVALVQKPGKAIRVGVRPLLSVLFGGRDHTVVRIRDLRGEGRVARELYVDAKDGLAASHDLYDPALPSTGGRRLVFDAQINGRPAVVRRTGHVILIHERTGRRESARITVVHYPVRGTGRRGSCPAY